jgi:hypothetical protein
MRQNSKDEVDMNSVKENVYPGVLANVVNNPDLKVLRDNKVTFVYNYIDKNGIFVCQYKVHPGMYGLE